MIIYFFYENAYTSTPNPDGGISELAKKFISLKKCMLFI